MQGFMWTMRGFCPFLPRATPSFCSLSRHAGSFARLLLCMSHRCGAKFAHLPGDASYADIYLAGRENMLFPCFFGVDENTFPAAAAFSARCSCLAHAVFLASAHSQVICPCSTMWRICLCEFFTRLQSEC